jgi:hypothetical protein
VTPLRPGHELAKPGAAGVPRHACHGAPLPEMNSWSGKGVSHAVYAPELYLANLLMPYVIDSVRERGVLPYPMRADFPVSWASHLDIADVVAAGSGARTPTPESRTTSSPSAPSRPAAARRLPQPAGAPGPGGATPGAQHHLAVVDREQGPDPVPLRFGAHPAGRSGLCTDVVSIGSGSGHCMGGANPVVKRRSCGGARPG